MTMAQVNSRGDVSPATVGGVIAAPFDFEFMACRVTTTSDQNLNADDAIVWHSDSASFCFNGNGLWSAGDPTKIILPAATADMEFWQLFYWIAYVNNDHTYYGFRAGQRLGLVDWGCFHPTAPPGVAAIVRQSHSQEYLVTPDDGVDDRSIEVANTSEGTLPLTVLAGAFFGVVRTG